MTIGRDFPRSVDSLPMRIWSSLEGCLSCRRRFPLEFRRDVVTVARKGEAPLSRIAKDFGTSESCGSSSPTSTMASGRA
jgi:transposase-like protein